MRRTMGRAWLSLLPPLRSVDTRPGHDFTQNLLHADTDAICPRCFTWIGPADIVRRTAYGLLQHEACSVTDEPKVVWELSS
jgi:hypothetical protein